MNEYPGDTGITRAISAVPGVQGAAGDEAGAMIAGVVLALLASDQLEGFDESEFELHVAPPS